MTPSATAIKVKRSRHFWNWIKRVKKFKDSEVKKSFRLLKSLKDEHAHLFGDLYSGMKSVIIKEDIKIFYMKMLKLNKLLRETDDFIYYDALINELDISDIEIDNEKFKGFIKHYFASFNKFKSEGHVKDHKKYQMYRLERACIDSSNAKKANKFMARNAIRKAKTKFQTESKKKEEEERLQKKELERIKREQELKLLREKESEKATKQKLLLKQREKEEKERIKREELERKRLKAEERLAAKNKKDEDRLATREKRAAAKKKRDEERLAAKKKRDEDMLAATEKRVAAKKKKDEDKRINKEIRKYCKGEVHEEDLDEKTRIGLCDLRNRRDERNRTEEQLDTSEIIKIYKHFI